MCNFTSIMLDVDILITLLTENFHDFLFWFSKNEDLDWFYSVKHFTLFPTWSFKKSHIRKAYFAFLYYFVDIFILIFKPVLSCQERLKKSYHVVFIVSNCPSPCVRVLQFWFVLKVAKTGYTKQELLPSVTLPLVWKLVSIVIFQNYTLTPVRFFF